MDQRYKMIFFCQRCNREHDRTNQSIFDAAVKCDYCNGFVVSPSGRANIQLRMTVAMFSVRGNSQSAWIAAKDKSEALDYFINEVESDYHGIQKLSDLETQDSRFMYDPEGKGREEDFVWFSGKDLLTMIPKLPAAVYVISNEELEESQNRGLNDES